MNEGMNEKKRTFVLGMITGIALVVVLGGVYMLGQRSGGASGGAVANPGGTQPTVNQPTQPSGPEGDATKIAAVSKDDHIRGDVNAEVTLIEYSDFECPFCARFRPTVTQALAEYQGKVRLVYRHFPLRSIHPQAQKAAEASECASEQGKFWEMHDKLFDMN
ncbi:MAG: thioredoxin domain-containing protein, partial [Candidatus Komeilibacteria bacterium]|nr:thioredoxin domain-containing protein [Candidatus Komeilibacteria bacterium]